MGRSPLGQARLLATLGGVVLLIVMFLPWYGVGGPGIEQAEQAGTPTDVPSATAWEAFDFIDILLVLLILAAIAPVVVFLLTGNRLPPAAYAITALIGILATLLVAYRLIDPPDPFVFPAQVPAGFELEVTRKFWAFVGLLAVAAITVGAGLAAREELRELRPHRALGGPGSPEP
jgi:hypothetical protein